MLANLIWKYNQFKVNKLFNKGKLPRKEPMIISYLIENVKDEVTLYNVIYFNNSAKEPIIDVAINLVNKSISIDIKIIQDTFTKYSNFILNELCPFLENYFNKEPYLNISKGEGNDCKFIHIPYKELLDKDITNLTKIILIRESWIEQMKPVNILNILGEMALYEKYKYSKVISNQDNTEHILVLSDETIEDERLDSVGVTIFESSSQDMLKEYLVDKGFILIKELF